MSRSVTMLQGRQVRLDVTRVGMVVILHCHHLPHMLDRPHLAKVLDNILLGEIVAQIADCNAMNRSKKHVS